MNRHVAEITTQQCYSLASNKVKIQIYAYASKCRPSQIHHRTYRQDTEAYYLLSDSRTGFGRGKLRLSRPFGCLLHYSRRFAWNKIMPAHGQRAIDRAGEF